MKEQISRVAEFHEKFNQPIVSIPKLPNKERRELRRSLLQEEYFEYEEAEIENNLIEIADALADMVVIICGTALEYGIPLDIILQEVHRSNMSKLGYDGKPVYREDGKVIKGPNYSPPNIKDILNNEVNYV